jgi:hypothetical protein
MFEFFFRRRPLPNCIRRGLESPKYEIEYLSANGVRETIKEIWKPPERKDGPEVLNERVSPVRIAEHHNLPIPTSLQIEGSFYLGSAVVVGNCIFSDLHLGRDGSQGQAAKASAGPTIRQSNGQNGRLPQTCDRSDDLTIIRYVIGRGGRQPSALAT